MNNKCAILLKIDEKLKKELEKEADSLGISTLAYIRLILISRKK